jgi:hypothetical protein
MVLTRTERPTSACWAYLARQAVFVSDPLHKLRTDLNSTPGVYIRPIWSVKASFRSAPGFGETAQAIKRAALE